MEKIKFRHFKTYLTSQPFFIWNSLPIIKTDYGDDLESMFFSFQDFTQITTSYSEILTRTNSKIDKWLLEYIIKKHETIVISGTEEKRIETTKKHINSGKVLLNPLFEYNGALASPFAYDTLNHVVVDIKYSLKTSRKEFLKAFWNISIIKKNKIIVSDYNLFLPKKKDYRKKEIDLYFIKNAYSSKTGKYPGEELDVKTGCQKDINIFNAVANGSFVVGKKTIYFPSLNRSIQEINNARIEKKVNINLSKDITEWGKNYLWNELLVFLDHKYAGYNGHLCKKYFKTGQLPEGEVLDIYNSIGLKAKVVNKKKLLPYKCIKQAKYVVWYDFEGYSLSFAPLDHVLPNHQLPFQVSIILTINNVETKVKNIVKDPLNMTINDLGDIVKDVYANKADVYVVYNRGYENARLKEIIDIFKSDSHPKFQEIKIMVDWIIDHTIDLYDVFRINSINQLPGIILGGQKGKSSIKNIEKYITLNNIKLPRMIVPYQELDIKNGTMAMEIAIKRALNIIGNSEWNSKVKELERYCENDVRAMIMVYDFIEMLNK